MPESTLQTNVTITLVATVATTLASWVWLYRSKQTTKQATVRNALLFALRSAVLYFPIFGLCYAADKPFIDTIIVLLVLPLIGGALFQTWGIPFGVVWLAHQFVCGLPAKNQLILEPQAESDPNESLSALIGQTATTIDSLRPSGTINYRGETHHARSCTGMYIDSDTAVRIRQLKNGICLVETEQQ